MKRVVVVCILVAALGVGRVAAGDTFAAGTLIIPMDTTYQDSGMLKAYGLVYSLLRHDVPVRWVILPGKSLGQADFTASGKDHQNSTIIITNYGYRGGPFVIDAADAAAAGPVINAWQAANASVKVHEATAAFTATVARYLVVAPRIAMHADGSQNIAVSYLNAAGIPDSNGDLWPATSPDLLTPTEVAGPTTTNHRDGALFDADGDPVYCQFMSMHWAVTSAQANPEVVAEVREYLRNPVHFFAECQAVDAFENLVPYGHFLTPNGFDVKTQPTSVDIYHADQTFMQIDGAFGTTGGSEPAYALPAGDTYKSSASITLMTNHNSPPGAYDVWMTGYLDGACPPDQSECGGYGKVSYLGGHQYTVNMPISTNPKTQGVRLFLNSLFDSYCAAANGQPSITLSKTAPATVKGATITFTIDYLNQGPTVALSAVLTDSVPAGTTFVSATSGGTLASGKVTWNLGNLGVGEAGGVSFTVTPAAEGTYTNTARLSYLVGLNGFSKSSNTTSTVFQKDTDGDGVPDSTDICPTDYNPAQDLDTDVTNCGSCGHACPAVTNGHPGCVGGICTVGSCDAGHSDCDGSYGNGCEYDDAGFASDPANCGGCGITCATGFICTASQCVLSACPSGTSDCNGLASDGCEYDNAGFATDTANCGGCGHACAFAHASGDCVASQCARGPCDAGWVDLDGDAANGCEYACTPVASDDTTCDGVDDDCNGVTDDDCVPQEDGGASPDDGGAPAGDGGAHADAAPPGSDGGGSGGTGDGSGCGCRAAGASGPAGAAGLLLLLAAALGLGRRR
jgi:uncharacterized repeat protein (TIGR01451 family)/MYXO-CTERM domain-containing protein